MKENAQLDQPANLSSTFSSKPQTHMQKYICKALNANQLIKFLLTKTE